MKDLNKYNKTFSISAIIIFISILLSGCSDDRDNPRIETKTNSQSTLLIYAVATNSLTNNLISDKNEMLEAAKEINLNKNNILIFETQYKYLEDNSRVGDVNLLKLVKIGEEYDWEIVKDFNDGVASLSPDRIKEVINYTVDNYPSESYGLVFWSHSTASQPYFPSGVAAYNIEEDESFTVTLPEVSSFGQDIPIGSGEQFYQINIDVLASSIPNDLFNFIWFDSCYMSNIETIYQFRDKCETFVGYPTEVLDAGLPYQYVLPYMIGKNPDLKKAADLFYQYYSVSFGTIAVVDMSQIEDLADMCKNIYQEGAEINSMSLIKYSRYSTGPFYDFGDYTKEMLALNEGDDLADELDNLMDSLILYKASTDGSLLGLLLDDSRFSGISTHLYTFEEEDSDSEKYYKSLDWYKKVFL